MKVLVKEKLSPHKFKTPEGYLICQDAVLARTGKQEYLKSEIFPDSGDDSIIEIDRSAKEVFAEQTLASFENKPLTCEHPYENVTPDNYKDLAVGYVRDIKRGKYNNQDVILGTLVVTDPQCIEDIENGYRTDLSCGYDCDITDGDHPEQINIRGNHVALCMEGRAGIAKIIDSKRKDSQETGQGSRLRELSEGFAVVEKDRYEQYKGASFIMFKTKDKEEAIKYKNELEKEEKKEFVVIDCSKLKEDSCTVTDAEGFVAGSQFQDKDNATWTIKEVDGSSVTVVTTADDTEQVIGLNTFKAMIGTVLEPAKQQVNDAIPDTYECRYRGISILINKDNQFYAEYNGKRYIDAELSELKNKLDEVITKEIESYMDKFEVKEMKPLNNLTLDSVTEEEYSKHFYKEMAKILKKK